MALTYLSTKAVAATLSVSGNTVRRRIETGELRAINVAPPGERPRWRISEDAIRAYTGELAETA